MVFKSIGKHAAALFGLVRDEIKDRWEFQLRQGYPIALQERTDKDGKPYFFLITKASQMTTYTRIEVDELRVIEQKLTESAHRSGQ